jgi:hypothetical protein
LHAKQNSMYTYLYNVDFSFRTGNPKSGQVKITRCQKRVYFYIPFVILCIILFYLYFKNRIEIQMSEKSY